jgi:ribosomal protein S18 acetylase RimI-like enzyme
MSRPQFGHRDAGQHADCGHQPEDSVGTSTVRTLTAGDEDSAFATILMAFAADPMARWTWPKADQYLAAMPRMARAFGGRSFAHGSALAIDGFTGVALWLPPGVEPDGEGLSAVMESTVESSQLADGAGVFEQMAAYHPHEPHWYLPLIGVDPAHFGEGRGDALMAHALARCDSERALAYLESSNPRNISLYERHGFEALGAIQVGSTPPLVPMLRKPR